MIVHIGRDDAVLIEVGLRAAYYLGWEEMVLVRLNREAAVGDLVDSLTAC